MLNHRHASVNDASQRSVLFVSFREGQHRPSWRHSVYAGVVRRLCVCALALGTVVSLAGCSTETATSEITVAGSTTCLPIAEMAGEEYKELTSTNVLISGLGSSAGIEAVSNGTADIATSSRELNSSEQDLGLDPTVIAHDGIAVIVNEENPVKELSLSDLRKIYAGEITNWSEVGGLDEEILLVNRDEASGTREAFKSIVMDGQPFDRSAAVLPGTGQVRDVVSRSRNAIGYISMGFVDSKFANTTVSALTIDGIVPSEENVTSGTYPVSRDLYFFTKGEISEEAKGYISYVTSPEMDSLIRDAGFVPVDHSLS